MITIWKTPIVATVEQVLKDLKLQLYGAGLLKEIKNTGSDLMCTCPFHANGKEHNPSCGVLLQQKVTKDKTYEAGTVHCYTCGYTADLPQFVADLLGLSKDNKDKLPSNMFSQSYKPLIEAFDKATPVIGERAKKLFEDFAKECDIIYKKQQETFDTKHEKLKEQYRSGEIDWKKYNSLFKKLQKEVNEEADNNRRALFGGGVSGLQDIYDAVSKGTFRDTGQVTYGHGSAYYTDRRRTNPNCSESLANYASLCVGHPELIDILAEDYPEIVTALRGCVEAMLKEVPK